MNQIHTSKLYIGKAGCSTDSVMKSNNIKFIINISNGVFSLNDNTYTYFDLPLEDKIDQNILDVLSKTFNFIEKSLIKEGNILVCCTSGISVSAAIIIAFIMYKEKINYKTAKNIVQKSRPSIELNVGQIQQLKYLEYYLKNPMINPLNYYTLLFNYNLKYNTIKGMIYGQCIGDALGMATEFMPKIDIQKNYTKKYINYTDIVQDRHRSRFKQGDWSDDSDQMLLILECINENQIDYKNFAKKLINWANHGFPELGDKCGNGLGHNTAKVLMRAEFVDNPFYASFRIWEKSNGTAISDGAVMRTSIFGILQNIDEVIVKSDQFCKSTHWDIRCRISCVFISVLIHLIIYKKHNKVIEQAVDITYSFLVSQTFGMNQKEYIQEIWKEFIDVISINNIKDLKLEEKGGYTYAPVSCAIYGLRRISAFDFLNIEGNVELSHSSNPFEDLINDIIKEGGDADTNAAVCGAVCGAWIGFQHLPDNLTNMYYRTYLDSKLELLFRNTLI